MDSATFSWLLTESGQRLLRLAADAVGGGADALAAGARLRRESGEDGARVAAAMTQAELRAHARAKFGDLAESMYFTRDALEQATRLRVAEHRAARLVAAATHTLIDLGCGIGGDLIAAARAGIVVAGVDTDPVRAAMARANLAALGLGGAVQIADAATVDVTPFDAAFADPARRTARGRAFDVEAWQPGWDVVLRLLGGDACVKVAPGIPHQRVPDGVEAEWVSDASAGRGEVKEAVLWAGRLATTARRATVLGRGGLATLTDEDESATHVRGPGRFLFEPDGAVIRAGLVGAVAAGVGGGLLDEHIAWVTGDDPFVTPFAAGYVVREEVPFHEKPLRAALRARGVGPLTVKTRGVGVRPEQLRTRLALRGDTPATLVLTRARGRGVALLVEPLRAAGIEGADR